MGSNHNMPPMNNDKKVIDRNIRFMDTTIYTILLDSSDNVLEVINHSSNTIDNEIYDVLKSILGGDKKRDYIGFLYTSKYSYSYSKGNQIILIDNSKVQTILFDSLKSSLIIFIILEIIMSFISRIITEWISRPVLDTFNKQKDFVADASHELKTPLSVIVASAEALENNPKEKKWLLNIKNEAYRMNNLIVDLLDLAKTEQDGMMELKEGNLSKAVELSVLTFEGRAYEKNIKLNYEIDKDIYLKMNEGSIRQVVEILLDNAIKHSKEKGQVLITLKTGNNIILTVSNEGEGIPKGEEEKIFERFYRVDKSRNRNENRYGLGLAIAKNIILRHDGKISAESKKGVTEFKVLLKK